MLQLQPCWMDCNIFELQMTKTYREGPIGALMDEYERATEDFKNIILSINQESKGPDFESNQEIIEHVIRSGYIYANYIRKQFGDSCTEKKEKYKLDTQELACQELVTMLAYTVETLNNKWEITEDNIIKNIIKTSWGQNYDLEQLLEHAIVHILRHRRQIEKILVKQS